MKIQRKPDYLIFADSAKKGENINFPDVSRGWGVTIDQTASKPPMEWMNGAFNRIDKNMLYLLQQGVPEWSEKTTYPVNAIIKYNGILYTSIAENDNTIPPKDERKWKKTISEISPASTTQSGVVKLNSAIDSDSQTEAATSLAVKTVNDNAVKKTGDTIRALTISNGNNSALRLTNEAGHVWQNRTYTDGSLGFERYDPASKKWIMFLRYVEPQKKWQFNNVDNVTINGKSALKMGDGGLLSNTQTISDVFSPDLKTGFYRFDSKTSNSPQPNGLGYINRISWNDNESVVIAYMYNSNRVFTGYKDKSTGAVKYSELLKRGDYGVGTQTGTTTQNLSEHMSSGFYGTNTSKIPNLPFAGGGSAASLLVLPTESPHWKVEQLSVADGWIPKIYYRTDTKTDGKQNWYEAITTANINDYLPVGVPQPWPTTTPPAGWFECNGAPFDKNKCKKLAVAYPSGHLPDLRGEFIRGWDNARGADPYRVILSWQPDGIRNIVGKFIGSAPVSGGVSGAFYETGNYPNGHLAIDQTKWRDRAEYAFDAARVVPVSHDNHPRNVAFMYIVKAE